MYEKITITPTMNIAGSARSQNAPIPSRPKRVITSRMVSAQITRP